jgi:drug/metabolite transporter (DMT)-like permease
VSATLLVVYLGVVPTALAFTTWAYALNRTTAGKMGVTTYIVPVLVVLMSWAFLGETPRPLAYVGGVLCLAGVAISRGRRPVKAEPVAEEPVTAEPITEEPVTG